jgi:hypothetical protein
MVYLTMGSTTEKQQSGQSDIDDGKLSLQNEIDDSALKQVHTDIIRTLNRSLDVQVKLGDKSIQLVQIDGLLLTILVGAGVQLGFGPYMNLLTASGVILILVSMCAGVAGYLTKQVHIGIGPEDIEVVSEYNLSESEYLHWVTSRGYSQWVRESETTNNRKEKWVQIAIFALLIGMILIVAGIVISVGV